MTDRRDFFKGMAAFGVLASPATTGALGAFFDGEAGAEPQADVDKETRDFWAGFLDRTAAPVIPAPGEKARGGLPDSRPVFLHYHENQGFRFAAELEAKELLPEGDVRVSLDTSAIKIAREDQKLFDHLQNAQVRLDVAQRWAMLPVIEQLVYTSVSAMLSVRGNSAPSNTKGGTSSPKGGQKTASSGGGQRTTSSGGGSVQSIALQDDAAWQKMQNVILPSGEGRWALNLEAQKKDSLMHRIMQNVMSVSGLFAPFITLPGIAMTALQSFNSFYTTLHSQPVKIIQSDPTPVFATQEAVSGNGGVRSTKGILLRSGTYVLMPASHLDMGTLKDLTLLNGMIVPPKTERTYTEAAAAETLPDTTYVTFNVQAGPVRIQGPSGRTGKG